MNSSYLGKRLLASLALLLLHFAAALGQTPPAETAKAVPVGWREFTSAEGRFKVRVPAEPQYRKVPTKLADAITADQHLYVVHQGDAALFMVGYVDLPPGGNNPRGSIEGAIVSATRDIVGEGGRVLSTGDVSRGTCEGRAITGLTKDSATGRPVFRHGEFFRSGVRAYILLFMAAGSGDEPATRAMSRAFMESFEVADGCRAALPPTKPLAPKTTSTVEGTPDAATGWRHIASAEQGFGVLLPGPATLERSQFRAEPVEMFSHTYMHVAERALYAAEVKGDYPPGFFSGPDAKGTMLDIALGTVKRALEPHGVTLQHLRDLKHGRHEGREYALVSERLGGAVGRAQVYITPKRIYWFAAVDADPRRRERDLERFFSSIKIEAQ